MTLDRLKALAWALAEAQQNFDPKRYKSIKAFGDARQALDDGLPPKRLLAMIAVIEKAMSMRRSPEHVVARAAFDDAIAHLAKLTGK